MIWHRLSWDDVHVQTRSPQRRHDDGNAHAAKESPFRRRQPLALSVPGHKEPRGVGTTKPAPTRRQGSRPASARDLVFAKRRAWQLLRLGERQQTRTPSRLLGWTSSMSGGCSSADSSILGWMQKSLFRAPDLAPPFRPRREPLPAERVTCIARPAGLCGRIGGVAYFRRSRAPLPARSGSLAGGRAVTRRARKPGQVRRELQAGGPGCGRTDGVRVCCWEFAGRHR